MGYNIIILLDLNCLPASDYATQKQCKKWVQEYLLTTLTKLVTNEASVTDYSKIMWSFKLFNSAKEKGYPCKKFEPFTISSFEHFESSTSAEYEKFFEEIKEDTSFNRCTCLSKALKEIVTDFRWEEIDAKYNAEKKITNMVYAVMRVPRNEDELCNFVDLCDEGGSPKSTTLMNALLPSAFLKQFGTKLQIQLNLIDTWVLHKVDNLESGWDGSAYPRQVVKVLDYLNKGKILQLEKPQMQLPGLPSYFTLLKQALRNAVVEVPTSVPPLSRAQKVLQSKADSSTREKPRASYEGSIRASVNSNQSFNKMKQRDLISRNHKLNRRYLFDCGNRYSEHEPQSNSDSSSHLDNYGLQVYSHRRKAELSNFVRTTRTSNKFKEPSRRDRFNVTVPSRGSSQNRRHCREELDLEQYSRTIRIAKLATKREHKKWIAARDKDQQERNALSIERRQALLNLETLLEQMKVRLKTFLQSNDLEYSDNTDLLLAAIVAFQDKYIAEDKTCVVSLAQTVVKFVVEKITAIKEDLRPVSRERARAKLEETLYIPTSELRSRILKAKNDDIQFLKVFRLCQYQILVRMESSFLLLVGADVTDCLRDEIVDLLIVLSVYVKKPVDDFLNNVLLWGYLETHSEMLIRIFRGLNMAPPKNLMLVYTPSKSARSRCSLRGSSTTSHYGSMESLLPPAASAATQSSSANLRHGVLKRTLTERSLGVKSNKSAARLKSHVYVNNTSKMLLVPVPNMKKFRIHHPKPIAKSPKPSPASRTRVRRNLFDDHQNPCEVVNSGRAMKSLRAKCQDSLMSPRLRALRSKRTLDTDDEDEGGSQSRKFLCLGNSPDMFSPRGSTILCPGTPSCTSHDSARKSKGSPDINSLGDIITESPEAQKDGLRKIVSNGLNSFYSTGTASGSNKSKVWENAGIKMVAAKVKRQIDSSSFIKTGLTLSDIEILGGYATSAESKHCCPGTATKSNKIAKPSSHFLTENIEIVKTNANPNIEALIRSNQSLAMLKTTPKGSVITATPTKNTTFNFDENLVRTPGRGSRSGTPKSILKTPIRHDGTDSNTPRRCYDSTETAIRELATQFSPIAIQEVEEVSDHSRFLVSHNP